MYLSIREQALSACRHLLSELNRDPSTTSVGCFDRRFWAWKLTDFPEATFQRNAAPLCWYMQQPEVKDEGAIQGWVKAAFLFTARIQHRDGSFDQAYPYERSYGATAFLLPDLISAYTAVQDMFSEREKKRVKNCLTLAAELLCKREEQHEFISNHLAGAALGLLKAHQLFEKSEYLEKSNQIIAAVISAQSEEGWFPEYSGADPGYQTLCMYYLAQIYRMQPSKSLHTAIERSLAFLTYFAHPDGSFGGEYGSRRTEIYYPGGIALLADEFPAAAALTTAMIRSIENGRTTTVMDVDIGNTAPLLSNTIMAIDAPIALNENDLLPMDSPSGSRYFEFAGIGTRSHPRYYAIYGLSNGGVLKVFRKADQCMILDDCGLFGITQRGNQVTSQIHDPQAESIIEDQTVQVRSRLGFVATASPNPFNYLLLRAANLTFMRVPALNEWIKKLMVKVLIKKDDFIPIERTRRIQFGSEKITIVDRIKKDVPTDLVRLQMGQKFSAIHMASARYFAPGQLEARSVFDLDCEILNHTGSLTQSLQIDIETGIIEHLL